MKKMILVLFLTLLPLIFVQAQEVKETPLGFSKIVDMSFDEALTTVKAEFKKEGFGVLTEVDVQATMKKKMKTNFRPYH
ncbi:MAG: hypothetical protein GF313_13485, partial [Caldithrix sp.]|nr:hypothetical protein [Caldithrix sp.]